MVHCRICLTFAHFTARNIVSKFNVGKTKVMVFGKLTKCSSLLAKIVVNGEPIEYINSCRYLGFYITSSTCFKLSTNEDLRGFFGSVNSVLSSVRRPKENVLMHLLFANCVPKLTYGAAVKQLNANETNQYNVALNNAIRRIFGFRRWQSIRQLREVYGYDSIEMMFAKAKKRFNDSLTDHPNGVLRLLSTIHVEVD